jgi:hypothetical protein
LIPKKGLLPGRRDAFEREEKAVKKPLKGLSACPPVDRTLPQKLYPSATF